MLFFQNLRNEQINKSQNKLLNKLLVDSNFTKKMFRHPLHCSMAKWLPENGTGINVIELGCGPGKYVAMLSTLGFNVTGVDPLIFPTWDTLLQRSNVKLLSGVFSESLPFKDNEFDHSVCLGALLYFSNPEKAMQELKRVLKPGGKIIVRTVNATNLYTINTGKKLDPSSKQLYKMDELVSLLQHTGFTIHQSFTYGFWPPVLTNFWWYLQCVWLPLWAQELLSSLLPARNRVNNIVFASK
jgi:SAM-dependent methyltransferase